MRRRPVAVSAIAAGLVAIALVAWLKTRDRADAAAPDETVTVERRSFAAAVTAIGKVMPQIGAEVRVGSRISGRVQRLGANIGDRVQKGQVIAELETADLAAVIDQRRAELSLAEAKQTALETLLPDEIARAEAEVARFEATQKLAAEEWGRQQALLLKQLTSRAEVDAARERNLVARAQLESAQRSLDLLRAGTGEQRKQAEAERARARAALERALVDRSFATIRSPISGIVASVATQEGETVAAGLSAPTFVTIIDLQRLQVDAYVDEVDIGKVQVGQSATFTVDAFPARDFEGRVSAIYPSATIQDNVVKYVVAIGIAGDYGGLLRPEMTASVRVRLTARTALAVPTRAVRRVDGRSIVYRLENGRPQAHEVRLGWRDGTWVEVVGLAEGERILVDPSATGLEENP